MSITKDNPHQSVLLEEVLNGFQGVQLKVFYEATLGAGGHAAEILQAHPENDYYIGCDRDPDALDIAQKRLLPKGRRIDFVHGDFAKLDEHLRERDVSKIDGIFFDLGVSSMQLDQGEKGFSFIKDGPLDMRMDPSGSLTARNVVNQWSQDKLEWLFRQYGEEKKWKQAARAIVEARKKTPIETTKQLADLITTTIGKGVKKKLHPATLVFQALRICVNHELESLQLALPKAIEALRIGGRIGVMSFHRLEDRIVKSIFQSASARPVKREAKKKVYLPQPLLKLLTKKPIVASQREVKMNRRARSAKLRFAERI